MTDDMPEEKKTAPPSLRGAVQAVIAAAGTGFVAQHLFERLWPALRDDRTLASAVAGLVVFALLAAVGSTRVRLLFLSSKHLAVAVLGALGIYGMLGTFIIQGGHPTVYENTYGGWSRGILYLLLDDVFHSMPFAAVMGLGAAGLLLSFFRKKVLGWKRIGVLATHGGCLLVLAGASMQALVGMEGRVELREGDVTDRYFVEDPTRGFVPEPLGFELRLDEFELVSYEPEVRLRVVEVRDGRQELVHSVDPAGALGDPGALERWGVRVTGYWPDHDMRFRVDAAAEGDEDAVAALGLSTQGGAERWLFATGHPEDMRLRLEDGTWITFFWSRDDAGPYLDASAETSPHVITAPGGTIRVEPGGTYAVPGTGVRFEVKAWFNDLMMDPETREAVNRSDRPDNPALRLVVPADEGTEAAETWLFANYPTFHATDPDSPLSDLRYSYDPAAAGAGWIVVGETRSLHRAGEPDGEEIAAEGETPIEGTGTRITRLVARAAVSTEHRSSSEKPVRPVVRIAGLSGDGEETILPLGYATEVDPGVHVVLASKEDSDRAYLSTVSVIEGGDVVREEVIEVNHPLRHAGLTVYQSDFRPDDLSFSGFLVVRDPGVPVVYLGFALCLAGIVLAFYVGPRVEAARRRKPATEEEPA